MVRAHGLKKDLLESAVVIVANVGQGPCPATSTPARFCAVGTGRVRWGFGGLADPTAPEAGRLARVIAVVGHDAPLWLGGRGGRTWTEAEAAAAADAIVERRSAGRRPTRRRRSGSLEWRALAGERRQRGRPRDPAADSAAWAQTAGGIEPAAAHLLAVPPGGEDWIAPFLLEAARVATGDGRHEDALARLERAAVEPAEQSLRVELLTELGDARGARGPGRTSNRRTARRSAWPSTAGAPGIHLRLGRHLYGAGDYRAAALELDRGLETVALARRSRGRRAGGGLRGGGPLRPDPVRGGRAPPGADPGAPGSGAHPGRARAAGRGGAGEGDPGPPAHRGRGAGAAGVGGRAAAPGRGPVRHPGQPGGGGADMVGRVRRSPTPCSPPRPTHAEREGETQLLGTALYLRAWPRYYAGRLAESEADVRAALATDGWEMYQPSARAMLAHTLIERGAFDEAHARRWRWPTPSRGSRRCRTRCCWRRGPGSTSPTATWTPAAADLAGAGELMTAMGAQQPVLPVARAARASCCPPGRRGRGARAGRAGPGPGARRRRAPAAGHRPARPRPGRPAGRRRRHGRPARGGRGAGGRRRPRRPRPRPGRPGGRPARRRRARRRPRRAARGRRPGTPDRRRRGGRARRLPPAPRRWPAQPRGRRPGPAASRTPSCAWPAWPPVA